jgi:hypothetical protein
LVSNPSFNKDLIKGRRAASRYGAMAVADMNRLTLAGGNGRKGGWKGEERTDDPGASNGGTSGYNQAKVHSHKSQEVELAKILNYFKGGAIS